ncbi:CDC27 protein [Coemansia guatemalensis]|uniref:DNA polymerase delta subunit 3 n=1 Tax=Coemansia guatemalensis TaxID=2761395 RepID=A0A9W8HSP1_9FUNG|nr:CDC27 protein [Coemansia guatemalensis]
MSSPDELLSLLVAHESQIVTYRRLSRELKVPANAAKQMLDDYYQAHKNDCLATFLITGTKRGSGTNGSSDNSASSSKGNTAVSEFVVRLVTESDLSSMLENVDSSYHHVYSVGPKVAATRQALSMANVVAGCNRDMADQCAVASSVERVANADSSHACLSKPASPPPSAKADVKPNITEKDPKKDNKSAPAPAEKDKKSFFGRSIGAKKHEKKPASSAKKPSSPVPEDPPKSASKTSPAPEQDEYANTDSLPRVEDMFMDDDDDDDDSGFGDRHVDISEQDLANADDQAAAKDTQDVEMANAESAGEDVDHSTKSSEIGSNKHNSSSVQQSESQSGGRRRVRKRRKINKIKHTKNSRGMLVSEAVEEWESYSESESEPEKRPQTTKREPGSAGSGTKRPAAKGGKNAAPQRSIMSFFGKK